MREKKKLTIPFDLVLFLVIKHLEEEEEVPYLLNNNNYNYLVVCIVLKRQGKKKIK